MKIQKRISVLRTIEIDDTDPTFCGSACPLRGTEDCPRREADLQEDLFGSGKEYRGQECEREFGLGPGRGA
jgi:hypothetical protein